uniref:hypothetical protein n=1 Tax=Methylobacterium sp. B34 TaxID=95563 RepID=UPI00034C161D|nr:hypothetical protein [Methylobacterium sp. B34]
MTNQTKQAPYQPPPGSLLDVMRHAGAEMARITLYLRSQGNVGPGEYPSVKTMENIRKMLVQHNIEVPANLDQVLGPRP